MVHQEKWDNYCKQEKEPKIEKDIIFKVCQLEREKGLRSLTDVEEIRLKYLKELTLQEFGIDL